MSTTLGKDANEEGIENHLPHAIIAQAEAAIIGNSSNGLSAASARRSSRSKPQSSEFNDTIQPSRSREAASSKATSSHLNVPQDAASEAPPAYGDHHDLIELSQDGFDTQAKATDDGRYNININQKTRKLSDLLVPALRNQLSLVAQEEATPLPPGYIPPALGGLPGQTPPPQLNVVIHVVGSRGDVQPFVALGKTLKSTYGHRVRLATHPTFQEFVEENGLEFFSIGGDPAELMAFMVKNPGLMPGFDTLKSGDVGRRRKNIEEMLLGCWRSCIEAGDGLGPPPPRRDSTESFPSFDLGINMNSNPLERPFIADAIIANPPSFAHVHIAEKLGVPLHMMFTMPWSPTQSFPHPLANIQSSNADVNMTNFVSYALVEMMTWQGLGDVINRFRERLLGLDPISLIWAPGMLSRIRVPYTYCWSPALIPKPKDWGQHISISGFYFLSLASSYTPAPDLAAFLRDGPPPVYIGFGSIVVDDPDAMTTLIFDAVKKTGCRALVSKGWGGLGGDALQVPEGVFMLGNVPHDWLFQHVSCVVHHGGAGTTAAGISTGKPTVVVPFFGDQPFWGAMVARAGAGPVPTPYKDLTSDKLAAALTEALQPAVLAKAKALGERIKEEKGTEVGGKSFHDMLDVDKMRCSLAPNRVAVWRIKRTQTRLSALAANILASKGLIDFADLKLYRPREYQTEDGPWDPISGGASALLGTIASLTMGVADFPIEIFKVVKSKKEAHSAPKDEPNDESSSGSITPPASSRVHSTSNHGQEESDEPNADANGSVDSAFPRTSMSTTSTKSTFESMEPSSTDAPSRSTTMSSTSTVKENHIGSLRQALRGTLSRSGSRSNSRDRSSASRSQSKDRLGSRSSSPGGGNRKEFDPSKLTIENAIGASKGVSRIVGAGIKSPMDFTLGLARGFHNAPKLYGDDTVRPQERVVDLQSGLVAAGKEFGYGFYDGISGLITQPIRGAEKEGAAGLIKGIGKGIGGLILKPGAAIWGLPGYAFMGIHKEIRKRFGSSVLNYIISARTAQGFEDARTASQEEQLHIMNRWIEHKSEYQSAKQKINEQGPDGQDTGHLSPKGFLETRHLSFDERKRLHEERKVKREQSRNKVHGEHGSRDCPFCRRVTPHKHTPHEHTPPHVQDTPMVFETRAEDPQGEFEQAIHDSVAATSRGNVEEDLMIERAIRASVRELQNTQGSTLSDQEALDRAIKASIAEAGKHRSDTDTKPITMSDEDAEHQAVLEKAIQQSLLEYKLTPRKPYAEDRDAASDDDEDIKLAIQKSKEDHEHSAIEDQIVMDYVKNQSLAQGTRRQAAPVEHEKNFSSNADEEALKQAIEESMKPTAGPSHSQ